jgi:diketogulonate reductase-like aldo/keto reductase
MPHRRQISRVNRRDFIETAAAWSVLPFLRTEQSVTTKAVPSTGELIPVIGMGTWLTFDVGRSSDERARLRTVLQTFFDRGGRLIDSSPMYGRSEGVIGDLLPQVRPQPSLIAASKVWIYGKRLGVVQIEDSRKEWRIPKFDLLQVHNLLDWEAHLETLREMKANGRLRYIGVTTSHGRRHDELERIMAREKLDFVQFTYNFADRSVEQRLLPLARERGIAVIINRPLDGGDLFNRVRGKPLPPWAGEIGVNNWAQYFLKFVVSHPAVTVAIPATSQPSHMVENMGAAAGVMPDARMRQMMIDYFTRVSLR